MSGTLTGRTVVVTGAARGIGNAVYRALALAGAEVIGLDREADELRAACRSLNDQGQRASAFVTELSDAGSIDEVLTEVLGRHARIHALLNVAGVIRLKNLEDTTLEELDLTLGVNLRAPFLIMRRVLPHFKAHRSGTVINVSSRAGVVGCAQESAYCASKFGLEGLTAALAQELADGGWPIDVATVTPGVPTRTPMSETTYGEEARRIWRDPFDITPAFVHLVGLTPGGSYRPHVDAWKLSRELQGQATQEVAP
ncbi:SDR family NAD(P)-dependent oxidoreductase [Deinococcus sp. UYEF24]